MRSIYKSKIGLELIIFMTAIFGFCCYGLILEKSWGGIVFLFSIYGFILLLGLALRYEVNENNLYIRFGLFNFQKIPIEKIRKIIETNNILSAPAFSLDRLEIFYNKFDSVLISPKNKTAFIVHLKKLNPDIQVKLKKNNSTFPNS